MTRKDISIILSVAAFIGALTILPLLSESDSHIGHAAVNRNQDPEKNLDDIRAQLKETKRSLAREGKYACCIAPPCDFCAIAIGECPCNDNLSKGDPVCHECKGGWMAGHGVVDEVDPERVKTPPREMNKMMYDSRAKKYLKKR